MLARCHAARQPVVVQGGLTRLSRGATPRSGEVALSMERFRGIVALDVGGCTLTAAAGTPLAENQKAAELAGLMFPLDLGSHGSCTIGGIVATARVATELCVTARRRAWLLDWKPCSPTAPSYRPWQS